LEQIENVFNLLFSFYEYRQKSLVGAVAVPMLFVGETVVVSNASNANHVVFCLLGSILPLGLVTDSFGLESGLQAGTH
jgi:hypothetical protein